MPTVINNPQSETGNGMGMCLVLGIIVAILIGMMVFFVYGWPWLQGNQQQQEGGTNIDIQIPNPTY